MPDDTLYIPFTQFFRPHGRQGQVEFICDDREIYKLSQEFIQAGGHYEIEELQTGMVHMDAWMRSLQPNEPLTFKLCLNGPPVVEAVHELVRRSHKLWKEEEQNANGG